MVCAGSMVLLLLLLLQIQISPISENSININYLISLHQSSVVLHSISMLRGKNSYYLLYLLKSFQLMLI